MSKGPHWTFGRFVWHELSTPDMARSQAFYSELLGWKYQSFSGGSDPYQLILVNGTPQGGLVAGDTSQLMPYVSVPDVDAAAAATVAGGGEVLVHPLEVPGVGRLAVLADAGGAAFSILRNSGGDVPDQGPPRPGQFAWHQLECPAGATGAAAGFYAAVLGWAIRSGGESAPFQFRSGPRSCAGLTPSPTAAKSRWLGYLAVDDLPAARQRATRLGGRVLVEQLPIADRGTGALIADNLGTVFGLMVG
jgi:predicted enzyme related to lactoylglutathione lyase